MWLSNSYLWNPRAHTRKKTTDMKTWGRCQLANWTAKKKITVAPLPGSLQDLYSGRTRKRAKSFIKDPLHPAHTPVFILLPSSRRYISLSIKTTRHKTSFFPDHHYFGLSDTSPPHYRLYLSNMHLAHYPTGVNSMFPHFLWFGLTQSLALSLTIANVGT